MFLRIKFFVSVKIIFIIFFDSQIRKAGYNCYKNYDSHYTDGIAENIFKG